MLCTGFNGVECIIHVHVHVTMYIFCTITCTTHREVLNPLINAHLHTDTIQVSLFQRKRNDSYKCEKNESWKSVYTMYIHTCKKSDCLGCVVLLCLVVCLTLLASYFLLSLKHVYTQYEEYWLHMYL